MSDEPSAQPKEPKALEGLNRSQREAVLAEGGPVLVEAAVGSGKTRVLTRRLAWLLETGRTEPGRLLVLTFTNRAAREMRLRVRTARPGTGRGGAFLRYLPLGVPAAAQ